MCGPSSTYEGNPTQHSNGWSIFNFSANQLHKIKTTVAMKLQMIAAQGSTTTHLAMIAVNRPNKPLQTSATFQWPKMICLLKRVVRVVVLPARVVVMAVQPMALLWLNQRSVPAMPPTMWTTPEPAAWGSSWLDSKWAFLLQDPP
jgi:hypothetical protein